jgi:hypothetical protein
LAAADSLGAYAYQVAGNVGVAAAVYDYNYCYESATPNSCTVEAPAAMPEPPRPTAPTLAKSSPCSATAYIWAQIHLYPTMAALALRYMNSIVLTVTHLN